MRGFFRMPTVDFEEWNTVATANYFATTGDATCTDYTYSNGDTDPAFVWARVEHGFIKEDIKIRDDAFTLGMSRPDSDVEGLK